MNTYLCNIAENFTEAIEQTVLGMLMIFAVLAILWGCIELLRLILSAVQKKKSSKVSKEDANEAKNNTFDDERTAQKEETPAPQSGAGEGEIVAAITAALAEYLGRPEPTFRVVSFKKVSGDAHWNK